MSRSGYSDDLDTLALGRWRAQVASAMRGKRGQRFLFDLISALDALPEKRLIADVFARDGDVCALGALCRYRGIGLVTYDYDAIGVALDIAPQLARETMSETDEMAQKEV